MSVEVWITGIGLVSSLGEGVDAHWQAMAVDAPMPRIDAERFAPYPVHPLVPLELEKQIPKRGDQRQMEPWQRIGTYAAGMALADSGLAGNADLLARTDMIVAAGGGERDVAVDSQILEGIEAAPSPGAYLNERLVNDLRPTLFLAQLPNLLAGNISIVHKVTGSSRTFMGEEAAGVSAVEVAWRRLGAGQGEMFLVGAAYNAERKDLVLNEIIGGHLWQGSDVPSVWERSAQGGGMVLGSIGAFLVLEARPHAEARGARPYATLGGVASDRCRREPGAARANAERQFAAMRQQAGDAGLAVLSGAGGSAAATAEERDWLRDLAASGAIGPIRAPASLTGAGIDASFPANVALAAIALRQDGFYRPADDSGLEQPADGAPDGVIVTSWGHWRGEGMALLTRAG